jgi:hypothetical protein
MWLLSGFGVVAGGGGLSVTMGAGIGWEGL